MSKRAMLLAGAIGVMYMAALLLIWADQKREPARPECPASPYYRLNPELDVPR